MSALDTLLNLSNSALALADLRFCLVAHDKKPFKIDDTLARPNVNEDFVEFEQLLQCNLEDYAGVGISIQASDICAIDVDDCFSTPFDISSADDRATYTIEMFKELAYIEFSFSGKGLRVLFRQDNIDGYEEKYYTKNSKHHIEYYQPNQRARYVTVTGKTIANNIVDSPTNFKDTIIRYLDKYMLKPKQVSKPKTIVTETRTFEELMIEVKRLYFKDSRFQELWFGQAPGSGRNESELDYQLLAYIYEKFTQSKQLVRQIFEESNYFKSKDKKHMYKWTYDNYRYFNYQFDNIEKSH